jgi:Conserved TM helix
LDDVLRRGLSDAWSLVATFVPKLLGFLLILLVGWLIAKAVAKAVELLLTRTGFPRLIERGGLGDLLTRSKVDITGLIIRLAYYFVLLIALQLAFGVFGAGNAVSVLLADIVAYLPRIAVAIILVVVAAAIARAVRDLVVAMLGGRAFAPLLGNIANGFLLALGVIAALDQLGIATTVTLPVLIAVLATVAGVLIVGVGGGLVRPMQERWQRWLGTIEDEARGGPQA